jgi:hypothetical protein
MNFGQAKNMSIYIAPFNDIMEAYRSNILEHHWEFFTLTLWLRELLVAMAAGSWGHIAVSNDTNVAALDKNGALFRTPYYGIQQ